MEGTYDKPYKCHLSLCDYWDKLDGVIAEMQIISYSFIILKHIQIDSQYRKLSMLKVRLHISVGDNQYLLKSSKIWTGFNP